MFGGNRGRLVRALCAGALLGAAAIAGCGGDDEEGAGAVAKGPPKVSAANEPPKRFAERMAKLIETTTSKKDCAQLDAIDARSYVGFTCPPGKDLRKSMASFEVVGAKEYGTGAVVDYRSGTAKDGAAILLFVSLDREWGIANFGVITEPSTATSDSQSRAGFDEAVDAYLAAIRERDCEAFKAVAYSAVVDEKKACKTSFKATERFAQRLKSNPKVRPQYHGGNASYGFYGIETAKPRLENSTITVVKAPNDPDNRYFVLNIAPSPTSVDQLRVRQQLEQQRRQQRERDRPETSPSRKVT